MIRYLVNKYPERMQRSLVTYCGTTEQYGRRKWGVAQKYQTYLTAVGPRCKLGTPRQQWQLAGKVIQKNQLDATMIYWSIRSAQHVSGNILPIIRSVRLRYLRCRSPSPYPAQQQDTICCKYLSLTLLMMGKILPETCWADLIDQ